MRAEARKALTAFHQSIEVFRKHPRSLIRPLVFSTVAWLLSVLLSYLVFASLGQSVSFVMVMIVYSLSVTIQNIPLGVPGEVGLVEITMTELYALLFFPIWGVPLQEAKHISAAATVLIRGLTVWFRLLLGFLAVQWIGMKALSDAQ